MKNQKPFDSDSQPNAIKNMKNRFLGLKNRRLLLRLVAFSLIIISLILLSILPFFVDPLRTNNLGFTESDDKWTKEIEASSSNVSLLSIVLGYSSFDTRSSNEIALNFQVIGYPVANYRGFAPDYWVSGELMIIPEYTFADFPIGTSNFPVSVMSNYETDSRYYPFNKYTIEVNIFDLDLSLNITDYRTFEVMTTGWGNEWTVDIISVFIGSTALDIQIIFDMRKNIIPTFIELIIPLINIAFLPIIYLKTMLRSNKNFPEPVSMNDEKKWTDNAELNNSNRKFRSDTAKWLFGFSLLYNLPWLSAFSNQDITLMMTLSISALVLSTCFFLTSNFTKHSLEKELNGVFAIAAAIILFIFFFLLFLVGL